MEKDKMLAFSDGVIAIIITILVLELKLPPGDDWAALASMAPEFFCHALSFLYIAIHFNNHHRMMHLAGAVPESIMWATLHWLFWLSLIPFTTGWSGENEWAAVPTALYGMSLLMPALAYYWLQAIIVRHQGPTGEVAKALGRDIKGKGAPIAYAVAAAVAFLHPLAADALYVLIAVVWLMPERRIEAALGLD